jgi:hypothetical protein
MLWTGWVLSALPILMMLFSAAMKFSNRSDVVAMFVGKLGYPEGTLFTIGVVELACAVLFAIPQTAVLGAVLVTGYLGGAIATHVRVGDPFAPPLALAVMAWVGLYLRDERLRELLPLRKA